MDQALNNYIDTLVLECLSAPKYASLSSEQKSQMTDEIKDKLYGTILDLVIDRLSDDQVKDLQDLDPNSQEMEDKLEEYSATIPNLSTDIEERLNQEVTKIKSA